MYLVKKIIHEKPSTFTGRRLKKVKVKKVKMIYNN